MTRDKKLTTNTKTERLADDLRKRIQSQEFAPGTQLPTEAKLIEVYGVSRTVVRAAIEVLITEGLVVRRHGSGTFVAERPPLYVLDPDEDPWSDLNPTTEPANDRGYAEAELTTLLKVDPGEHLFVSRVLATSRTTHHPVITRRVVPLTALAPIPRPAPDPYSPREDLLAALIKHYGPVTVRIYTRPLMPTGDQWPDLGITTSTLATEIVYLTQSTGPTPRALIADIQVTCAPVRVACKSFAVTGA